MGIRDGGREEGAPAAGPITKTGNTHVRRLLVESVWQAARGPAGLGGGERRRRPRTRGLPVGGAPAPGRRRQPETTRSISNSGDGGTPLRSRRGWMSECRLRRIRGTAMRQRRPAPGAAPPRPRPSSR